MNVNLQPQTPAIKDWLTTATKSLAQKGIPSAQLDAELILSDVLGENRTYLHAHSDDTLHPSDTKTAESMLAQRLNRVPIAYITGRKEFYGRNFIVTPDTLIPRPESEDIITILKSIIYNPKSTLQLIDIGTGSGCLGITAKLEFPDINVTLADTSEPALAIAQQNAELLHADVTTIHSDLLDNIKQSPDIIIANLPYVDPEWDRSPETDHEPQQALFAADNGQEINKRLLVQASKSLTPNGYIIIEADPSQHRPLTNFADKLSLTKTHQQGYIVSFQKVK